MVLGDLGITEKSCIDMSILKSISSDPVLKNAIDFDRLNVDGLLMVSGLKGDLFCLKDFVGESVSPNSRPTAAQFAYWYYMFKMIGQELKAREKYPLIRDLPSKTICNSFMRLLRERFVGSVDTIGTLFCRGSKLNNAIDMLFDLKTSPKTRVEGLKLVRFLNPDLQVKIFSKVKKDPNPDVMIAAAKELRHLPEGKIRDSVFFKFFKDDDPKVRAAFVKRLEEVSSEHHDKVIKDILGWGGVPADSASNVRAEAVRCFHWWKSNEKPIMLLRSFSGDETSEVRSAAVMTIKTLDPITAVLYYKIALNTAHSLGDNQMFSVAAIENDEFHRKINGYQDEGHSSGCSTAF